MLGYSLLIKPSICSKNNGLIKKYTHAQLIVAVTEIKKTNEYTNLDILAFKQNLQIVATYFSFFYMQYF